MISSRRDGSEKVVVDSIHGDIHLTECEVKVIDTASFQRLRKLKQLAMAQMVYPTATHTRFSHSIGALGMMKRILYAAKQNGLEISEEQKQQLQLAALLHDVGHYPYSHLLEGLDSVELTEDVVEQIQAPKTMDRQKVPYPRHDELGSFIVTQRPDLLEALGGPEQAKIVAEIFTRSIPADPQLSKLIHSSFDIDRWDYLWRDSHGTGVPYGYIDINYLLNNLRASPDKILGFSHKALPAIEHFLLARFFMYRVVYYHKTTFGMEEACRQLLRRLRDGYGEKYDIPSNGDKLKERINSDELNTFTDAFVDRIIQHAVDHEGDEDKDKVIRALACSIQSRRPPKLIKEVQVCEESGRKHHEGTAFFEKCRNNLKNLSEEFRIPLGQFLLCSPSVTIINNSGQYRVSEIASLNADELRSKKHKEEEEQIWIFKDENLEPESFWDLEHSLVKKCAKYFIQSFRLYVVYEGQDKDNVIARLREAINDWDKV